MEVKLIKKTIYIPKNIIVATEVYTFSELSKDIQQKLMDKEANFYECPYISNEPDFKCPNGIEDCNGCDYEYPTDEYLVMSLEDEEYTIDGDFINE